MLNITSTQHAIAYISDAHAKAEAIRTLEHIAKQPAPPGLPEQVVSQRGLLIGLAVQLINLELKTTLNLVHHHLTRAKEGGEL